MAAPVLTGEYFEHITGPGERWDTIAHQYYNNAGLSHLIIEANRDGGDITNGGGAGDGSTATNGGDITNGGGAGEARKRDGGDVTNGPVQFLQPIPVIIPSGAVLRVPVIDVPSIDESLLPPWKRK